MAAIPSRKQSLKKRLMISIIFVHAVIFFFTLVINYAVLFYISEKQMIAESENNLSYMNDKFDNLFSNLSDIRNVLGQNSDIMEYIHTAQNSDPSNMFLQINTVKQLNQLVQSYTYLDSIALFQWNGDSLSVSRKNVSNNTANQVSLPVQTSESFCNITPSAFLSWGGIYKKDSFFPNLPSKSSSSENTVSLLMPLINIWHPRQPAVISVNVPTGYFNFMYSKTEESGSSIYLYDQSGNYLFHSPSSSDASNIPDLQQLLSQSNASSGQLNARHNNVSYKIIYHKNPHTGWYLVEEIPYSVFLRNIFQLQTTMGFSFLIAIILILLSCIIIIRKLLGSLDEIANQLSPIGNGNLKKRLLPAKYTEFDLFISNFNQMMDQVEHLMQENVANEQEKRELEIAVLQSQINPHFLYNSLTTIRWMASIARVSNVCEALLALNNVLRPIFSTPGIFWETKDEQIFLENFIAIMNYRFGGNISCSYEIPEALSHAKILRFLLQPIVENSISHGLRGKPQSMIQIKVSSRQTTLVMAVRDNGCGMSSEKLEEVRLKISSNVITAENTPSNSHGFGLYNVNRRIKLQYGDIYGLTIFSEEGVGTTVQITLPLLF